MEGSVEAGRKERGMECFFFSLLSYLIYLSPPFILHLYTALFQNGIYLGGKEREEGWERPEGNKWRERRDMLEIDKINPNASLFFLLYTPLSVS